MDEDKRYESRETGLVNYIYTEQISRYLKREFGRGNDELAKVAKLKKVEQKSRIIEKFVQEFRRVVRGSRYKGQALVKNLKRKINIVIQIRLIEAKRPSRGIKQWYKRATNLNQHQRENKREKERLREKKKKISRQEQRQTRIANIQEGFRLYLALSRFC